MFQILTFIKIIAKILKPQFVKNVLVIEKSTETKDVVQICKNVKREKNICFAFSRIRQDLNLRLT